MIDAAELAAELYDVRARERVVVCPGKLPDGFWTWIPDVEQIEDVPEPEPPRPLPLPTALVVDELLWRSALAKYEAAKRCEEASRTIHQAREICMRAAACRAERAR